MCSPSQHQWEISLDFLPIFLENTFVDLHVACGLRCALILCCFVPWQQHPPHLLLQAGYYTQQGLEQQGCFMLLKAPVMSEKCKRKKILKKKKKTSPQLWKPLVSPDGVRTGGSRPAPLRGAALTSSWCSCMCCFMEASQAKSNWKMSVAYTSQSDES